MGGGNAEMGDAQTMAAVKNVRSIHPRSRFTSTPDLGIRATRDLGIEDEMEASVKE